MVDRVARPNMLSLVVGRFLGTIASVRPHERRHVIGAFMTLFGFMCGHALLETARDALFLARWPASQLPWVYLAIAVAAFVITERQDRILRRFQTGHELSAWFVLAATVTVGFWVLIRWTAGWSYYGLYVWSGVLATLIVVRFWTVLGGLFTLTQAKRLFAVIGSGSVLGALAGSAIARAITEVTSARHVVLAAAVAFLAASLAPRLLTVERSAEHGAREPPGRPSDPGAIARLIWQRPYLRRVAALILLATVVFTLVDFVFKSAVDRAVPAADMGAFFATTYLSLNVASLAVQVFVASWLVRRLGINTVLAIIPALFVVAAAGFVASAGLATALALKGVDGSLRHSLYRTGTELLFVPLSVDLRGRVKTMMDVVGQRGGQALASLAILGLLGFTTRQSVFAFLAGGVALVWLVLALDLRTHYVNFFRESLREEQSRMPVEVDTPDAASLEMLLDTLNDPDERKVLAAVDLLAARGETHVIPALLLYHPSPRVVVDAIDRFVQARRSDILPAVDHLQGHGHPDVAAAALRARSALRPDEAALRAALDSPVPEVVVTALVVLGALGWLEGDEVITALQAVVDGEQPGTQLALAAAIRCNPSRLFHDTLVRLSAAGDPSVRLEAVRAMAAARSTSLVPALVPLLGERALREEARRALVGLGAGVLPRLVAALEDRDLPHGVRRHLPHGIAALGTPRAAGSLVAHLIGERDGMIRFKILQALGTLRADHPGIPLDEGHLTHAFQQTLGIGFRYLRQRQALDRGGRVRPARRTAAHRALVLLLRDKQLHAVERLFRLLNLLTNDDDFARIHRGLQSVRAQTRAGSRELVEHLVFRRFREPLLALIDDLYEPASSLGIEGDSSEEDVYEVVLLELFEGEIESLSCLAAAQIAALGLKSYGRRVREREPLSPLHGEVVRNAQDALERVRQ